MNPERKTLEGALLTLIGSLLIVGAISGTMLRHVVQVIPAIAATILAWRGPAWSRAAARPVFIFWLLIVILIWLHALGVAHVVTGRFTPAEVGLTVAMAVSCVVGIAASLRASTPSSRGARGAAFLFFAAVQVGAMWLSLRPPIAGR